MNQGEVQSLILGSIGPSELFGVGIQGQHGCKGGGRRKSLGLGAMYVKILTVLIDMIMGPIQDLEINFYIQPDEAFDISFFAKPWVSTTFNV